MNIHEHFREPSTAEAELIRRLMAVEFPGREEIRGQVAGCRVRIIDNEGSLEIQVSDGATPAAIGKRIPVEAEGVDEDGIHVHFLLHVANGLVRELQIYKDDGTTIRRMPRPDELDVIVLPTRRERDATAGPLVNTDHHQH